MLDQLLQKWHSAFGHDVPAVIVRAPGRVNIIGEHTDYNDGWVLPGAMSRSVYILMSANDENFHHWIAYDLDEQYKSGFLSLTLPKISTWVKYVEGALKIYADTSGPLKMIIGGDLPVGAGISSSSALVCGILYALQQLSGRSETKEELAKLGSRVEREVIGLQGGIMDQYAIMLSRSDHLMMLDCRTRLYQFISAHLPGCKWLLINTKVKHQLIDSDYNNRSRQCRDAVAVIQTTFPDVKALRDVTLDMLHEIELPDVLRKRCVFVIEENIRVQDMVNALQHHDAIYAGQLIKASHAGLRDQYEVSCEELDHLADFGNHFPGVYGARMMGGGFGGCVIYLVAEQTLDPFINAAISSYTVRFGFQPEAIQFELGSGVEII